MLSTRNFEQPIITIFLEYKEFQHEQTPSALRTVLGIKMTINILLSALLTLTVQVEEVHASKFMSAINITSSDTDEWCHIIFRRLDIVALISAFCIKKNV